MVFTLDQILIYKQKTMTSFYGHNQAVDQSDVFSIQLVKLKLLECAIPPLFQNGQIVQNYLVEGGVREDSFQILSPLFLGPYLYFRVPIFSVLATLMSNFLHCYLKSSKMGPHIVLILLKSPLFFPNENFLTSSPQSKISFMGALYI